MRYFLLLVFIFCSTGAGAVVCQSLFGESDIQNSIRALAELRLHLDLAQAENSNKFSTLVLQKDYQNKESALIKYLDKNNLMPPSELRKKIKIEISRIQSKESEDRQLHLKSIAKGTGAIFYRIEPGSFKMGDPGNKVDVTITKAFEMMATKTTQIIWQKVAELANRKLGHAIVTNPSNNKEGDTHPVEMVSHDDVTFWFKALNELSQAGEPELNKIIPFHKKGDSYRLPTEAEWEFVMRERGTNDNPQQFTSTYNWDQLVEYAWSRVNAGGKTQPVALLKPLGFEEKEFFDMLGNVYEWVSDFYSDKLPGGIDPMVSEDPSGMGYVMRGGSFENIVIHTAGRTNGHSANRGIGFRMVKEVRTP